MPLHHTSRNKVEAAEYMHAHVTPCAAQERTAVLGRQDDTLLPLLVAIEIGFFARGDIDVCKRAAEDAFPFFIYF